VPTKLQAILEFRLYLLEITDITIKTPNCPKFGIEIAYCCCGDGTMLDAFIIEKLKKEKEKQEQGWQPLPLELPVPVPEEEVEENNQKKREREKEKNGVYTIYF
jgi:hypothetical protein